MEENHFNTDYFHKEYDKNNRSIFVMHPIQDVIVNLDLEDAIRKLVYKSLYKIGAFKHN